MMELSILLILTLLSTTGNSYTYTTLKYNLIFFCPSIISWLSLSSFNQISASSQEVDEIDATFTDIVSQIDNIGNTSPFDTRFIFDSESPLEHLFPRLKILAQKLRKIISDLRRGGMEDEADVLKYTLIRIASFFPYFDGFFANNRPTSRDNKNVEKSVDDLDSLIGRYERVTTNFRNMPQHERLSFAEKNKKTQRLLAVQQSKLVKKCHYVKSRIQYLLSELYSHPKGNKTLTQKLSTWKRFIENNEYVLNQRMTRDERDLLYSFLSRKLKESDDDLRQTEDFLFDLV